MVSYASCGKFELSATGNCQNQDDNLIFILL